MPVPWASRVRLGAHAPNIAKPNNFCLKPPVDSALLSIKWRASAFTMLLYFEKCSENTLGHFLQRFNVTICSFVAPVCEKTDFTRAHCR